MGVVLVRGPGLESQGAEVERLAKSYAAATVLSAGEATTERVLHALDGARLAHIAAHGRFRADSPMFSSMLMEDGPLTVYDFGRLRRAPAWLVMPACDSGLQATAGADELLGLASTLLPLGTVGIIGSVVPVNDRAVVPLMVELHNGLRSGRGLAESLRDARRALRHDPIVHATGLSFVVLGAG